DACQRIFGQNRASVQRGGSAGLLEDLMTPEPHVLPDLCEPVESESPKCRLEVEHDMLRTSGIWVGGEATEEEATGAQGSRESVDRLNGIGQVLEDIHRGDEIESLAGQLFTAQVDRRHGQPPSSEPPSAEVEQG